MAKVTNKKKRKKSKKNANKMRRYVYLFRLIIVLIVFITAASVGGYYYINALLDDLPPFEKLEKYEPSLMTKVYSADSVLIKEFYEQNRNPVDLDSIPISVKQALLATEDRKFESHWGFNTLSTIRAAVMAVPRKLIGKTVHGASTITQQLARNLYNEIGFKKNIERKIKELLTSIQLETMYSKKEILEMYLTQCYFGDGAHGIQSGSEKYFGKNAKLLKVEESALLIAQLKAPSHYNPYRRPKRALRRRNVVMHNMFKMNYLTKKEYDSLKTVPITVVEKGNESDEQAPYFAEYVRQQLNKKNKIYDFNYLRDGLNVYTTIDSRIQAMADSAVQKNLKMLDSTTKYRFIKDRRNGLYKYVKAHYDSSRWKEKMKDTLMIDSLAEAKLKPQVALLALNPENGHILAMVGGRNFEKSKFNRTLQAWRQPGSIFKPIIYLTALDNGYKPTTRLLNQPVVIPMPDGSRWTPGNYDRKNIGGLVSLREALRKSLNIISVRLISNLISPRLVIDYAKKFGIDTRYIPAVQSIALGTGALRPIDIITAYGAIANKGTVVKPMGIVKISDKNGQKIEENFPDKTVAVSEETTFLITKMMQDVVRNGTGRRLGWKYGINWPVAGKTGTTNQETDGWFCGFTPKIAVVVWVGLDDEAFKLGRGAAGGNTALPVWGTFVKDLYRKLKWKKEDFTVPEGIDSLEICKDSYKVAGPYCPKSKCYMEYFNKKYLPVEKCDVHSGSYDEEEKDDDDRMGY